MNLDIIEEPFTRLLHGRSIIANDQNFAEAGMPLMEAMFREIANKEIGHKGVVHWVYDHGGTLFIGVQLQNELPKGVKLERKEVTLPRYAHYKHRGSYGQLGQVHDDIHEELHERDLRTTSPYLEIYSRWSQDESELETDILVCLQSL